MTHQRFRPYKHNLSHDGDDFSCELAMAVKVGNRIWLRGQTDHDFDGSFISEGDPALQAETAMRCSDELLREAGASLNDIVKLTVYMIDREYRAPVFSVLAKWLKGVRPCQTGLIVTGLARPEMLIELDIEAIIGDE